MPVSDDKKNETSRLILEHNVFIVWKPEYNLGIPILDEHHRGIVSIINSLHFGMQNNYVNDILSPIIDMMDDYTQIHFHTEENFLEQTNFPDAKKHIELHHELSKTLKKLGRESMLGKNSRDFMNFLKQWWIDHICKEDLQFRNYLFNK
ncbi:MAG: hemerythrin family protein [Treponema sp.]|nr:hemerythrin family protein [Treponema sp.]